MISRREFLKYTATGIALSVVGSSKAATSTFDRLANTANYSLETERDIPLLAEVDIVVMGGSARGVEAAVAAAKQGAKVFLVAELPYLGDEICGTLAQYEGLNITPKNICQHHLYGVEGTLKSTIAVKLLGEGAEPTTPLYMKSLLESELIDSDIDFLYSSLLTNALIDDSGAVAGIVIANRSGRQAIKAKAVIDATHTAELAKRAGAKILFGENRKTDFKFRVVGNSEIKSAENTSIEELPYTVKHNGSSYKVSRYTLTKSIDTLNYAQMMELEQTLRDNTFDPNQVDSSDLIEYLPPYTISAKRRVTGAFKGTRELPIEAFQPKGTTGVTIVGLCCDCSEEIREALTIPEMMLLGEIVGTKIAREVARRPMPKGVTVLTESHPSSDLGLVKEILNPLRPKHHKNGTIKSAKGSLPIVGHYDVIVMGGGTAGAPAAISAAKHGAKTLVIEYLHGLGGTGTFGMIGRYWDGFKEGFTAQIDNGVHQMAPANHPRQMKNWKMEWPFDWKVEWYRQQIRKNGGDIWFGSIGSGAIVKDKRVKGIVITTPFGRAVVLCDILIDSTGSADIAIAAGVAYNFIEHQSPAVQGAGLPKVNPGDHYNNTDWAFVDDSDILDVTRLFIQGKRKYPTGYDIGKLAQTRERRRVVGEYEVTTYDVINHRTYSDTISYHQSSFDTHGITINPLFTLAAPEREHKIYNADLPLRSLLPRDLDGIIVTGLGACADRDAMPVIRMQPCLQNQGYSVGYLASVCIKEAKRVRQVDIKKVQRYLVEIGNLPARVLKDKEFKGYSSGELSNAAALLADNYSGLEKLITQPKKAIELTNRQIDRSNDPKALLIYASITSILGDSTNGDIIAKEIAKRSWDRGWHYTGMGQFGECMGRVDSLIMALGNSRRRDLLNVIIEKGQQLDPSSYYSHFRAICEAFEAMGDAYAADLLYTLLTKEGMQHHAIEDYRSAKRQTIMNHIDVLNRNKALKELTVARALYCCGDIDGAGRKVLEHYANGLERVYARYAEASLKEL